MLSICMAVYRKNRIITLRAYPWSHIMSRVIGGSLSFLLPVLLYYYVFDKTITPEFIKYSKTSDYLQYMLLGQSLNILSFSTLMNVGRCLILEIREGTLDTFLISPASRMGYYVGSYCEQFGRSCIEFGAVLLMGILCGVHISFTSFFTLIIVVVLSSVSFFSVAVLVSIIMVYTRDTFITQNTIFYLMQLVCGVLFPIEYLPMPLQALAEIFPLTPSLRLIRGAVMTHLPIAQCLVHFVHMLLLSVIYLALGYFLFRKREKILVEQVLA